jgi:hypothetical protein
MHNLTNLLPKERARTLRQLYFLRLAVVGVLLLAGAAVIHGVFLLPSYLYAKDLAKERSATLAAVTGTLAGSEEQMVGARVQSLAEDSAYLARLATTPKASAAVSAILALPRPGIILTGFSFAQAPGGALMHVSGTASTREALRTYEQALKAASFVAKADLPISAYAKERDIEFTVALSGPFLP